MSKYDIGVTRDTVFQEIRPGAGFITGDLIKEMLGWAVEAVVVVITIEVSETPAVVVVVAVRVEVALENAIAVPVAIAVAVF